MDIKDKVDKLMDTVGDLRVNVTELNGRANNLERWMTVLERDVTTLERGIERIEQKIDTSLERQTEIVRDASTRVPKWAMWMFGTIGTVVLGVAGWVIDAVILHH